MALIVLLLLTGLCLRVLVLPLLVLGSLLTRLGVRTLVGLVLLVLGRIVGVGVRAVYLGRVGVGPIVGLLLGCLLGVELLLL